VFGGRRRKKEACGGEERDQVESDNTIAGTPYCTGRIEHGTKEAELVLEVTTREGLQRRKEKASGEKENVTKKKKNDFRGNSSIGAFE